MFVSTGIKREEKAGMESRTSTLWLSIPPPILLTSDSCTSSIAVETGIGDALSWLE